jgi:hypothetical protein
LSDNRFRYDSAALAINYWRSKLAPEVSVLFCGCPPAKRVSAAWKSMSCSVDWRPPLKRHGNQPLSTTPRAMPAMSSRIASSKSAEYGFASVAFEFAHIEV